MMTELPIPNIDAIHHSQQLTDSILAHIRANHGQITFEKYMDLALYAPALGYYRSPIQKFGATGDFVTAPEMTPLFAQCLARQCQDIMQALSHTHIQADILEIGAGSGQMAVDLLLALEQINSLPQHYYILELSADLQKRQQEKIASLCPQFLTRVHWLSTLPNAGFRGIILGNEILDAMPVHRFHISEHGIEETGVIEKNGSFAWQYFPTNNKALIDFYHSRTWATDYTSEINLQLKPWILSLADILQSGVILLIDYGFVRDEYYHPDRNMGTLMCHYRHHSHTDPFLYPGLQDITAHVDFTAIAEAALIAELDVLGFTNQAAFLLSNGLLELAEANLNLTELQHAKQNHAIQVLTSPAEMGELFKVIALGRNVEQPLMGFMLSDKRYRL